MNARERPTIHHTQLPLAPDSLFYAERDLDRREVGRSAARSCPMSDSPRGLKLNPREELEAAGQVGFLLPAKYFPRTGEVM